MEVKSSPKQHNMKQLIILSLIALLFGSCKKEEQTYTYSYRVSGECGMIGTATYSVTYVDGDGNSQTRTVGNGTVYDFKATADEKKRVSATNQCDGITAVEILKDGVVVARGSSTDPSVPAVAEF